MASSSSSFCLWTCLTRLNTDGLKATSDNTSNWKATFKNVSSCGVFEVFQVTWLQHWQLCFPWPGLHLLLVGTVLEKGYCLSIKWQSRRKHWNGIKSWGIQACNSYSEGWSGPSWPHPQGSPASSLNSASHLPYLPCSPHCLQGRWHWLPLLHLRRHRLLCLTFHQRVKSL